MAQTLIPYGGSYMGGMVVPPVEINTYSSLTVPAFRRAVQFIAENLASFGRSIRKDGSPLLLPHRVEKLLKRQPNGYQNAFVFWHTLFGHAAHTGNGYARINRSAATFEPMSLENLLPEHICPIRYDHGDGRGVQQYYLLRPQNVVLFGSDVIHIKSGISYDGMAGLHPAILHEGTFQRAISLEQFQTLYIQRGTNIRGTIEFPQGIGKDQVDEIQYILKAFFRGPDAERDVLLIPDGGKFNNTTISPEDSQLSKQTADLTKQISQITGVPPEFLFELSEAKYNSSVEQQGQNVVRYLFRPWIVGIEAELSLKLLSEAEQDAGYSIHINPDALLRGSTTEQESLVVQSVNGGIRTKNEGRALLGLPTIADPDANKLKALGDTGGPPAPPEKANVSLPTMPVKNSRDVLRPVIEQAAQRVDTKSDKAFETHSKKGKDELVIWSNVFAETVKKDVIEILAPISESIVGMGGKPLPVEVIAEKYSVSIRKRASTGEITTLKSFLEGNYE